MISVTIIVKNGERLLKEVLEAVKDFKEVILLDTGSEDRTLEIASAFPNVHVHSSSFMGFGEAHNRAAALAQNDWILSIDADEVLSPELAKEILDLKLDPTAIYSLPFINYFNGKWIRWCGWYPESHVRLYHRKQTGFSEDLLHEGVISTQKEVKQLTNPVYHYSYASISDFLIKMERYSTLFATQHAFKKKASPWTAVYHGVGAFFKSYFLKKGFLGGFEGFLISIYNGHTAFYKYLKLYQKNASDTSLSQNRQG